MEIMAFGTLDDKHNPNMNMSNTSCPSFTSNFPTTSRMIIIPDDDDDDEQERILLPKQKQKQKQALEILGYRDLYANYNTSIVARTTASHMPFNRSTLGVQPKSKIHKPIKQNSWYGHGAHQIPSSMMNLNPRPVFVTKQPTYVMVSSQPATERNGVIGNLQCSNEIMSFSHDFHANTANNGEVGHECLEGELQELYLSLKL